MLSVHGVKWTALYYIRFSSYKVSLKKYKNLPYSMELLISPIILMQWLLDPDRIVPFVSLNILTSQFLIIDYIGWERDF